MWSKETIITLHIAVQVSVFLIVCIFFFHLTKVTKNMYEENSNQEALKENMEIESDKYFFLYSDQIYGTDIIAYIIKYDATHDYFITINETKTYAITKDYAKELRAQGMEGNVIWTQDYLTNVVFKDHVYHEFFVKFSENWDGSLKYYINEK